MTTIDNDQTQVLDPVRTKVMGGTRLDQFAAAAKAGGRLTNKHLQPCNLIIAADCSSSVHKSIEAINGSIAGVQRAICMDPVSAEAAHVAVVAFNSEVKVLPLADFGADATVALDDEGSASAEHAFTPAREMPEVRLRAKGTTHLNEAVLKALELEREQVNRQSKLSPHRSVLVILSDGADYPGGSVTEAAEAIKAVKESPRGLKVLFCAFGECPTDVSELLAPDGYFQVEPGKPIDDFLDLVGKFMREFSSDHPGSAPNVPTKIGGDSPVHFISPRGMTFREFLAA